MKQEVSRIEFDNIHFATLKWNEKKHKLSVHSNNHKKPIDSFTVDKDTGVVVEYNEDINSFTKKDLGCEEGEFWDTWEPLKVLEAIETFLTQKFGSFRLTKNVWDTMWRYTEDLDTVTLTLTCNKNETLETKETSSLLCQHANECPVLCSCGVNCYCRGSLGTCNPQVTGYRGVSMKDRY